MADAGVSGEGELSVDVREGNEFEIMKAPAAFKSDVWKHFSFAVSRNERGEKVTDKHKTICRHCQTGVAYTSGNTSNMRSHLTTRHPEKFREGVRKKIQPGQTTLKESFTAPFPCNSTSAQEITRCIGEYIAKDLRPFSVVNNEGFRK